MVPGLTTETAEPSTPPPPPCFPSANHRQSLVARRNGLRRIFARLHHRPPSRRAVATAVTVQVRVCRRSSLGVVRSCGRAVGLVASDRSAGTVLYEQDGDSGSPGRYSTRKGCNRDTFGARARARACFFPRLSLGSGHISPSVARSRSTRPRLLEARLRCHPTHLHIHLRCGR